MEGLDLHHTLGTLVRAEWGRMVAALARTTNGDLSLAEDSLQTALLAAVHQWPHQGVPERPVGWLIRTARFKAVDQLRRTETGQRLGRLLQPDPIVLPDLPEERDAIPDDRLRLILTCCHPDLSHADQVALTLKTVCGLTSDEVARALLLDARTAQQRIVRAKKRIRHLELGWSDPTPTDLPERLQAVLRVVYLIFTEGYAATAGPNLVRAGLCEEGLRLGALVAHFQPDQAEVHGLMALMLLQHARMSARTDRRGRLVLLADQDRTLWDQAQIARGMVALGMATRTLPAGPFPLQAAIASVHARAMSSDDTDWAEILQLYDLLWTLRPTSVVALNRAVAVAMVNGPHAGLAALDVLANDPNLCRRHLLPSVRADLLRRSCRWAEASVAYQEAISKVDNNVERAFLEERLGEVERSAFTQGGPGIDDRLQ